MIFFIYGTNNFEDVFTRALKETTIAIKEQFPDTKFLLMYKHLFNVFEVVCVSDPNNFFKEDYKLDNFKEYGFKSLHRFNKHVIIDPETGKIYKRQYHKMKEITNENDPTLKDIENRDFTNYFEDGDVNGIRMHYRLQFILTKNKNIESIFENFDLYPSRVAFDGNTTWFTKKSEEAYKYMINIINENNYSELFDHRICKYFTYGFSIVLPELDTKKLKNKSSIDFGKNKFSITSVNKNCILVEHNSHIANMLQSLEALEKKNLKKGKALYKSSLFCSLVSLLRYIKINNISYMFTKNIVYPESDFNMKFQESTETIKFIDKIESRKPNYDLYKQLRLNPRKPEEKIIYDDEESDESEAEIDNYRYISSNSSSNKNYDNGSESESDTSQKINISTN